jgi:hypothetical protein
MKNFVLGIITSAVLFAALAFSTFSKLDKQEADSLPTLPTPQQIQRKLISRGYSIKADGVIGKETLDAWEAACCNDIMTAQKFELCSSPCPEPAERAVKK